MDVWDYYFGEHRVNLGIRGDKVEDVIWCIENLNANKELRYVVLICGSNSINKNVQTCRHCERHQIHNSTDNM